MTFEDNFRNLGLMSSNPVDLVYQAKINKKEQNYHQLPVIQN